MGWDGMGISVPGVAGEAEPPIHGDPLSLGAARRGSSKAGQSWSGGMGSFIGLTRWESLGARVVIRPFQLLISSRI